MIKRTLYFGNPAYLNLRNGQMVLHLPEVDKNESLPRWFKRESERTFPVEDLGVVVLDNKQITITQGLMDCLMRYDVAVVTCDSTHMPTGLLLPLDGHTLQSERFRAQIGSSLPLRKQLWQQTVQAKIANQAAVLAQCTDAENGCMLAWVDEVRSNDSANLEGRAAAYYWRNFFPEFPGFTRGREEAPPNNLLNYGYAILRAVVVRSLVGSGLLPTLGIHHHNRYNAYCLADDIMEPYRPVVDKLVKQIVRTQTVTEDISVEAKRILLGMSMVDVKMGKQLRPLMIAVNETTASLSKCFLGESRRISYPSL